MIFIAWGLGLTACVPAMQPRWDKDNSMTIAFPGR